MKNKERSGLTALEVIFFVLAAVMLAAGVYKNSAYRGAGDIGPAVNAYVGGDAYNLIINAQMATGRYVLAGAFFVGGVLCVCARSVIACMPGDEDKRPRLRATGFEQETAPKAETKAEEKTEQKPTPELDYQGALPFELLANKNGTVKLRCPACGRELMRNEKLFRFPSQTRIELLDELRCGNCGRSTVKGIYKKA